MHICNEILNGSSIWNAPLLYAQQNEEKCGMPIIHLREKKILLPMGCDAEGGGGGGGEGGLCRALLYLVCSLVSLHSGISPSRGPTTTTFGQWACDIRCSPNDPLP